MQNILTEVPHWMVMWGNVVLFLIVILLFGLASIIPYPTVIEAPVVLTTSPRLQQEVVRSASIIDALFVVKGQMVQKGQVLAVFQSEMGSKQVKAKLDGMVSYIGAYEDEMVKDGEVVFIVLPEKIEHYMACLRMPASEYGKLAFNQRVNLRIDNYPFEDVGVISATLPMEITNLVPNESGIYEIYLPLGEVLETNRNVLIPFQHELTGMAQVTIDNSTILERIFSRLKEAFL